MNLNMYQSRIVLIIPRMNRAWHPLTILIINHTEMYSLVYINQLVNNKTTSLTTSSQNY